jgi:hypothetical protein
MNTEERNARRATLLKDFLEGRLAQRAFCERQGLPISTLQYWLGRERRMTWARRPSVSVHRTPAETGHRRRGQGDSSGFRVGRA